MWGALLRPAMSAATLATHAGAASHQGKAKPATTGKATEPRGGNNNIKGKQNSENRRKNEKRQSRNTRKGGIAYKKVKEEKTRNPSWVHELWDEVLL